MRADSPLDAVHQQGDVTHRALPVELGESADGCQRGAKLVAGVGDEPSHLLLRSASRFLRCFAAREGALNLRQHAVERNRQFADLGALVALGDTLV